jgi:hypothetical protein
MFFKISQKVIELAYFLVIDPQDQVASGRKAIGRPGRKRL